MQLTPIASNMTEVETKEARILFSYRTPVAAYVFGRGYVKTEKWYSTTTTRHINKWIEMDMPVSGYIAVTTESVAQTYLQKFVQAVIMNISNAIFLYILIIILL